LGSLGAAMKVSAYFWLICSFFLFLLVFRFAKDVETLESRMEALAQQMER